MGWEPAKMTSRQENVTEIAGKVALSLCALISVYFLNTCKGVLCSVIGWNGCSGLDDRLALW